MSHVLLLETDAGLVLVETGFGLEDIADPARRLGWFRHVIRPAGPDWLSPDYFRIGASSLLNDLLMQRSKQLTGAYAGPDHFTLD